MEANFPKIHHLLFQQLDRLAMGDEAGIYKYEEMASKVLQTDRRLMDDRSDNPNINTNPQSIKEHISSIGFGDKVPTVVRSQEETEVLKSQLEEFDKRQAKTKHKKKPTRTATTVLDAAIQELNYTPTTESNVHTHTLILDWCSRQLENDVPEDVVASLADIIIEVLLANTHDNIAKKKDVEDVLGRGVTDEEFLHVYDLVKRISDYNLKQTNDEDGMGVIIDSESSEEEVDEPSEGEKQGDSDDDDITKIDTMETLAQEVLDPDDIVALVSSKDPHHILDPNSINRIWLGAKLLSENPKIDHIKQDHVLSIILSGIAELVEKKITVKDLEASLSDVAELENSDLLTTLLKNYSTIHFAIKLSEAKEEHKKDIFAEMRAKGLDKLVAEFQNKRKRSEEPEEDTKEATKKQKLTLSSSQAPDTYPKYLDLNNLKFTQGSHLMTRTTFQLPDGSFKRTRKAWEEIHIPPPAKAKMGDNERLIPISELPDWAQQAFPAGETSTLNRIQSRVYPSAFLDDGNLLMCAPTGAGKTNVAMLSILNTMEKFRNTNGSFKLNDFKIVFIAPLKALVQEQVREFDRRLSLFGITVNELTGDSNLTKHQIANTQILVTTPEKWDVITRKNNDASFVQLVRLVIIDEIHLLHDERGPVIESIVSRSLMDSESNVRFVGLSATLPNYKDVAQFLQVNQSKDLFYFDSTFRPCPLAQQFVGITEKKAFKKYEAMNEVCYEKVVENINGGHQMIIFVHSRKETEKTAKWIGNKFLENDQLKDLMKFSAGVNEILRSESEKAKNKGLKEVLQMGIGIHHAGMTREDRSTAEDLFAEGHIKVLVSTATLAWGVNLPAHTVIIKGTSVYSPEKGSWVNLSPQDILQMLGRAGRPRYDTHGEGIIITDQDEVKYYLAILNQQLPIESQMYGQLADSINAEIVSGSIRSLKDCIKWIGHTYLYVRMLHSRSVYYVGPDYDDDPKLLKRRRDLAYSALVVLAKHGLVKYNFKKDAITATDLGKIASYYYISHSSVRDYDKQLRPHFSEIELFRIFATSEEFKYIPVRREEKIELQKLMESAPIPVNEAVDDPLAKVNILLQAYISKLRLDGFALMADMVYVVQSAGRLFRAMYDLALRRKWSRLAKTLLDISKMIERRLWLTHSPLRQFPDVPREILQVSERSMTPWKYYLALEEPKLAIQAFKAGKFGSLAWDLLQKFPQISFSHTALPITPSLMMVQLEITPHWQWDTDVHGFSESFIVMVEDCDSERVLFQDNLIVRKDFIGEVHHVDFTVPLFEIEQPNFFVSIISEKWLHCLSRTPIMLTHMTLPSKFPAPTLLNDDAPLVKVSELGVEEFSSVFSFEEFNKFQSDAFDAVYNTERNILFNTSKGNGKTVVAELALLNHWKNQKGRAIYISPNQELVNSLAKQWKKRFSSLAGGKVINKLTGELNVDLKILAKSHLLLCTVEQFDLLTRRWKQRKNIQTIELVIADDIHQVGDGRLGAIYENIIGRMRFIQVNLEKNMRFVVLGSSLASFKDFADWLDVPKHSTFNFDPCERVFPVQVQFQKLDIAHVPSLVKCCIRPAYDYVSSMNEISEEERAIVFVPTRKQCMEVYIDFTMKLEREGKTWLRTDKEALKVHLKKIKDQQLVQILRQGVGVYYKGMDPGDRHLVEKLFAVGALTCLIATQETCQWCPPAHRVCVITTQSYSGRDHKYNDYKINDLLEMVGLARMPGGKVAKALVLTNSSKVDYYKRFLSMALPLESHANYYAHDAMMSLVNFKVVKNRQDAVDVLTYSLLYRRLQLNPAFYGLKDATDDSLSEYLSELVETTFAELSEAKLVELNIDDDENENDDEEEGDDVVEIVANTTCMIGAHHNVSFVTMQVLIQSLTLKTTLGSLLQTISQADEFAEIPMRLNEEATLARLHSGLSVKWAGDVDFSEPSVKTFVLLQAHMSRVALNADLRADLEYVLGRVLSIVNACVDILSSESHLTALTVMDLSQMLVQGMWGGESALVQMPHFTRETIAKCADAGVKTVYEFMEMEEEDRDAVLTGFSEAEVENIAEFVNGYPNLDLSYRLGDDLHAGEMSEIVVCVERDEEVEDTRVNSAWFTHAKYESWWIVVGDAETKKLYSIKKTDLVKEKEEIRLKFTVPEAGKHRLTVWCVSDSYCGADKQLEIDEVEFQPSSSA